MEENMFDFLKLDENEENRFYVLQVDEHTYVTNQRNKGLSITKHKNEAYQWNKYTLSSLIENFDKEIEEEGHFTIENHAYTDYTILQCQIFSSIIHKEKFKRSIYK